MIEVKRVINASAKSFYDHIISALRYELDQNGKAKVDIKEGVHYPKPLTTKVGTSGMVDVTITKLTENEYQAEFKSIQGVNYINYLIEPIDETSCEVTYSEDFVGANGTKQLNYKLMNALYKRRNIKRMNYLLTAIEIHLTDKGEQNA